MADTSVWENIKTAFDEPDPKPKTQIKDLDPDKAKAFSSVFNSDSYSADNSAMGRRLDQLKNSR